MGGIPRLASFINGSKTAQKVLRGVNDNAAMFSAVFSFGLAAGLRPLLIDIFSFKDGKDKTYSKAASVSAGLIELIASAILFIPLNKNIAKASRTLYSTKGSFYEGNKLALRQFKSVTNRVAKLIALVPMSLARFALITPVVKMIYSGNKEGVR